MELHLPLVHHLARRYRDRGEPLDDLVQVGTIGLIKAVDRFDTERGVEFSTYATPTIIGEIKRHFRDKGWAIRVPRRLQELRITLAQATAELSQTNRRSPTVAELAVHVGVGEDEVLEGLESAGAYSTLSLDAPEQADPESAAIGGSIGMDDEGLTASSTARRCGRCCPSSRRASARSSSSGSSASSPSRRSPSRSASRRCTCPGSWRRR